MLTIDKILDEIQELDIRDRIMITDILMKRAIEDERDELMLHAKESIAEYKSGKYSAKSAMEIIEELNRNLNEEV